MLLHEQRRLHCTSQWGRYTLMTEHVYSVDFAFKMTEQSEQQICIKFCIKLDHSSTETIWMIQKAAAVGNWWWAASSQHILCRVFGETSNHPGDSALLQLRFGALWLLAFAKTKITFEREKISGHWWDSGKIWQGSWWRLGELREVPRCLLCRELRHHCPMYNVSCIFFSKRLYFSWYMAGYFLDRPHVSYKIHNLITCM